MKRNIFLDIFIAKLIGIALWAVTALIYFKVVG